MKPEEAIEYNKNLKMYMKISDKQNPCKFLEGNYIALDMAIEALKEQKPHGEWSGEPERKKDGHSGLYRLRRARRCWLLLYVVWR